MVDEEFGVRKASFLADCGKQGRKGLHLLGPTVLQEDHQLSQSQVTGGRLRKGQLLRGWNKSHHQQRFSSCHCGVPLHKMPFCDNALAFDIPYKQKYWLSFNLAIWLQSENSKILAEFNIVGGPMPIMCLRMRAKISAELNLVVQASTRQTDKFNSSPIFPLIRYISWTNPVPPYVNRQRQ